MTDESKEEKKEKKPVAKVEVKTETPKPRVSAKTALKASKPEKPKKPEYKGKIHKEEIDGVETEVHRFGFVEIWRLFKVGKQHGVKRVWEQDYYRVKRLKTDKVGKVILKDENDPTSRVLEVIVQAEVDDNFKRMHKKEYDMFINHLGDRKDERYLPLV